ncbi:MAG: acetyl-CoA carboxylase biotin carboxylase subunit [Myxococcota bacterium]|nr:acetyl-CoA carboxylase biotin carboxylase subunit [Myxococcota bacterium]
MVKQRVIRRVLIANRGEIAVRIARACAELGLETVAVFSSSDRDSLHVRMATQAREVGPPPSSQSYLDSAKILKVAEETGCDAVHPGYGFLSENALFAQAVMDAGLVWVGPPPSAIVSMGSKTEARRLMLDAGVPVVPGGTAAPEDLASLQAQAAELGFPVMLKAAAGGGGKGMRLVDAPEGLERAWNAARSEARNSFGDDTVYLEKAIVGPRHVEVQVLTDQHGNAVHLFERDCSIQRRHQKVIEETPCPVLAPEVREAMCDVALKAAAAVDYVGAGTVEFLYGEDGSFYFLEMNTRLQVEHPITEMVTGIDLCRAQLEIAMGAPLPWTQDEISQVGHAMEFRIYAEDPDAGFLPAPGLIEGYREPGGPWVRVDSGVYAGWEVPVHYDPMIAKLVVWGRDREECRKRSDRALREYRITGIRTPIGFYREVLANPQFRSGVYDTGFLGSASLGGNNPRRDEVAAVVAAICTFEKDYQPKVAQSSTQESAWKTTGRVWGTQRDPR